MTRRDYCAECGVMVHDYDVMCQDCCKSLHHDCATTYDLLSEMCILSAKLNVLVDPNMTIQELNNFYKFIQTELVQEELNEMITQEMLTQEELTTYYDNIFNIVIKYENQDENQNISKKDVLQINELNNSVYLNDFLRESFVCVMCSKNIYVKY